MELFGFKIFEKEKITPKEQVIVSPNDLDGTISVESGGYYGIFLDIDASARSEAELISRYRDISNFPDVDNAIEEITSEAIAALDNEKVVAIEFGEIDLSDNIKNIIQEEFGNILKLLNFKQKAHDIFRRWYVDGRLYYQKVINPSKKSLGIQKLAYIDPRKIKKVKDVKKVRLPSGLEVVQSIDEYFIYNNTGVTTLGINVPANQISGVKISLDTIAFATSGIYDLDKNLVLSYLHKAIKPVNMLKMATDSMLIYRLARAPERRIFYIDVGNLPKNKAEEYMKAIMNKYRNKIVYDSNTGDVKDDRKFTTMLEDFWLPRRSSGQTTQIDTLPGASNLDQVEDINLLQNKVNNSLNIPLSRFSGQAANAIFGRQAEITREELKFAKFISRLRRKFADLFDDLLKTQLILKGIINEDEWEEIKENIYYKYSQDQYFQEVKEAEILRNRVDLLNQVQPYIGTFFSVEYCMKEILKFTDEEIDEMNKQNQENPPQMNPDGEPSALQSAALTKQIDK